MPSNWIVVADAYRARIFERRSLNEALVPLKDLVHPEGRMSENELQTGGRGSPMRNRGGPVPKSFEPTTEPEDLEETRFARQIAAELDEAVRTRAADKLVILAAPSMLGALRKQIAKQTATHVAYEEAIEVTQADEPEIRARVAAAVPTL